ncbi:hypothetical protein ACIP2X_08725 [Streptomyces sp. NPDC089424]|uniref:hypothetical protein n=1 Tax=Streptomyces sp. NPDC089424 TaxID=3365917 RepID=UPI0037FA9458
MRTHRTTTYGSREATPSATRPSAPGGRSLPGTGLERFVDGFARRVAGFDKVAVARPKSLVDVESLPTAESYGASLQAFFQTSGRPENAYRVRVLFERGLQRPDGVEVDLGRRLAD